MASTQFLDLTNKLLRRLNEVQISQANFPAVTTGVQAMAKDAINAALTTINIQQFKWPFNATSSTQLLTIGQTEYAFPSNYDVANWESFHIQYSTILGVNASHLDFINKDYYEANGKDDDLSNTVLGRNTPENVYKTHTGGFGVTPSPSKAYTVQYDYYQLPVPLSLYSDTPTVPTAFDEVIIQNALYHFYMFRDNTTQANAAKLEGTNMISQMRTILINDQNDKMDSALIVQPTWAAAAFSVFNI